MMNNEETDKLFKKLYVLGIEKPEVYREILDMLRKSEFIIKYAEKHMNESEINESSECIKRIIRKEFSKLNYQQMFWIAEVLRINIHLFGISKMDIDWRKQLE